jgi:glycosyltransferase involved in cell wall biosynthesis
MPIRIVIDVRRIHDFGIGTYIRNLVRALACLDQNNHYTLVTGGGETPELSGLPPNFQLALYSGSDRFWSELGFSFFLRRLEGMVFHIPLNAVPVAMPPPYVVTVHDVGNLMFEQTSGIRSNLRFRRLQYGLRNAARVLAVSNATRRDVEELVRIPSKNIRTIYNAPDPAFGTTPWPQISTMQEQGLQYPVDIQRVLDRYQIHYPYLLYAGRTNPQKNIPRLVEAFAVLRGELRENPLYKDMRLIIIGDSISKYPSLRHAVIQSRVEDSVRFLGFVSIETLRIFYQVAEVFVFPSLYEGFGLPPLEAMACGTPVVTSRASALAEAVGDAAVIINPENVFDISRGIREILLDRKLRASLVQRGFQHLTRFSWRQTARQVLDTYAEIAAASSTP